MTSAPLPAILLLCAGLALNAPAAPLQSERIPAGTFAGFVKNWDDAKTPVLCALIRDQAGWNGVFGAAAFMGNKRPFAPAAATWDKQQLLVVSRVMPSPANGDMDKAFTVQGLDDDGKGTLTLRYTFTAPPKASSTVKNELLLQIPRQDYTRVVVIENGRTVGELAPGKWVVPAPTP